jgi:hypothetical protein
MQKHQFAAAVLTIGQRRTSCGALGGYTLKVDARHGGEEPGSASEGYFLDRSPARERSVTRLKGNEE